MTESEAARLLADMRARYCKEPFDPAQDVTLTDIAAALPCTYKQAETYAAAEVRAGRMSKRRVTVNGHPCNVYRRT